MELYNLFGSVLLEEFACASSILSNCSKTTARVLYPDILPIPVVGSNSIQQSINLLWSQDQLRVRMCPDTNCDGQFAHSATSFASLPLVLLLQLQRFSYENQQEKKLDNDIHVPIELQPDAEGPSYILTGAVVHYGPTTASGHFVSLIRCPHTGTLY